MANGNLSPYNWDDPYGLRRFEQLEPFELAGSLEYPNRQRLWKCIDALTARKGIELPRAAGRTAAIAHMICWEFEAGYFNHNHAVITGTQQELGILLRYVKTLLTVEYSLVNRNVIFTLEAERRPEIRFGTIDPNLSAAMYDDTRADRLLKLDTADIVWIDAQKSHLLSKRFQELIIQPKPDARIYI